MTLEEANRKTSHILRAVLTAAKEVRTLRGLGPAGKWSVDVHVAGAAKVRALNAEFRGKDRPTDVLSFAPPEPVRRTGYLGELVICLPVLKKQAAALGHPPEVELRVLIVHGLLHLLGLDHERGETEAHEMAKWEAKLLERTLPRRWAPRAKGLVERNAGHC